MIWVIFGQQGSIIRNAIASVAVSNGSQIDTFIALSYYALIANPITPKNPKIFVPHQLFVKFWTKKADKMKNIFVGH